MINEEGGNLSLTIPRRLSPSHVAEARKHEPTEVTCEKDAESVCRGARGIGNLVDLVHHPGVKVVGSPAEQETCTGTDSVWLLYYGHVSMDTVSIVLWTRIDLHREKDWYMRCEPSVSVQLTNTYLHGPLAPSTSCAHS